MLGSYLSGGRLASEKLVIERAVRRLELGLEKYAAVGYGLQRGRAFVWEAEAYEELTHKQVEAVFRTGGRSMGNGRERSPETQLEASDGVAIKSVEGTGEEPGRRQRGDIWMR